jgi:soluble lytic murein transglycosylase-like protein
MDFIWFAAFVAIVILAVEQSGASVAPDDGTDTLLQDVGFSVGGDTDLASIGGDSTMSSLSSKVQLPADVSAAIDKWSAQYGVDPNLMKAQAYAESGGDQNAESGAGAVGVFQLEPATAADLGVDPTVMDSNVQGGVKYMSQLLAKYNGNQTLALAAYDAGMGNVAKYNGVPPFAETQSYIQKITSWVSSL